MTATPINTRLWYPSLNHFKSEVYKTKDIAALNILINNLLKKDTRDVHSFDEEEIKRAWGMIRHRASQFPGAYRMSDGTYRISNT